MTENIQQKKVMIKSIKYPKGLWLVDAKGEILEVDSESSLVCILKTIGTNDFYKQFYQKDIFSFYRPLYVQRGDTIHINKKSFIVMGMVKTEAGEYLVRLSINGTSVICNLKELE